MYRLFLIVSLVVVGCFGCAPNPNPVYADVSPMVVEITVAPNNGCGEVLASSTFNTITPAGKVGDACDPKGVVGIIPTGGKTYAITGPQLPNFEYVEIGDGVGKWHWTGSAPQSYLVEPWGTVGEIYTTDDLNLTSAKTLVSGAAPTPSDASWAKSAGTKGVAFAKDFGSGGKVAITGFYADKSQFEYVIVTDSNTAGAWHVVGDQMPQTQISTYTLQTNEFVVMGATATFGGDAALVMMAEGTAAGAAIPGELIVAGITWVVVEGAIYNIDCASGPHTFAWFTDGAQAIRICVQLPQNTPEPRHSQDDHDPRSAQTARERLKTVTEKFDSAQCREAVYQNGVLYLRVFVETGIKDGLPSGIVSWFRVGNQGRQNFGWAGAFEMTRTQFETGRPRGIVSIGEHQPCGSFTGAGYVPPTATQIAP